MALTAYQVSAQLILWVVRYWEKQVIGNHTDRVRLKPPLLENLYNKYRFLIVR